MNHEIQRNKVKKVILGCLDFIVGHILVRYIGYYRSVGHLGVRRYRLKTNAFLFVGVLIGHQTFQLQIKNSRNLSLQLSTSLFLIDIYKCQKHRQPSSPSIIDSMKIQGLIQDLKDLKQSKPVTEQPKNHKRIERYLRFEEENGITLNPKVKEKSSKTKKEGMFANITFLIPMIDPKNDPSPQTLTKLAKGIYNQGGRIVQFSYDLVNKQVKYVLVDEKSDIGFVRETLRGKVLYLSIINYRWIEDSLRKFARMDIGKYNLQNRYSKKEGDRKKLEQQEVTSTAANGQPRINQQKNTLEPNSRQQSEKDKQECIDDNHSSETELMEGEQQGSAKEKAQDSRYEERSFISKTGASYEEDCYSKDEQDIESSKGLIASFQENDHERSVSEETEKMNSDIQEDKPNKQPDPKRSQRNDIKTSKEQGHQIEMAEPSSKRKTKLSLGSHQFSINNQIVEQLKKMQQFYQSIGDRKSFAYLRAIACIKNYGKEIRNPDELRNIDGLGRETIQKVKEFLQTGSIKKIDQTVNRQSALPHKQLLEIYGIGPSKALEFYHKGIKSIQDLRKNQDLLNKSQRIGLKYYKDFLQRIPRQKVGRMLSFIRQTFFYMVRDDSKHEIEAVGSYRRGKATCGDIDILITRKDGYVEKNLLQHLVVELEKKKFITDHITFPKTFDGYSSVNYMGVCQFEDELHHRIDFKHYPVDHYAFALLYFTGSDLFNRQMRMRAHEKGLMLSDHGLKKKQRNGQLTSWRGGKIEPCYTEQDIFKLLGMEYRPPSQREL